MFFLYLPEWEVLYANEVIIILTYIIKAEAVQKKKLTKYKKDGDEETLLA